MLIKGSNLSTDQRNQVLQCFCHRNTIEHPFPRSGGFGQGTDNEWIADRAFYFVKDGSRLSARHRHCEPAYLAEMATLLQVLL